VREEAKVVRSIYFPVPISVLITGSWGKIVPTNRWCFPVRGTDPAIAHGRVGRSGRCSS